MWFDSGKHSWACKARVIWVLLLAPSVGELGFPETRRGGIGRVELDDLKEFFFLGSSFIF